MKLFKGLCGILSMLLLLLLCAACGETSPLENPSSPALTNFKPSTSAAILEVKLCTVKANTAWGVGTAEQGEAYSFAYTEEQLQGTDALLPGMVVEIGYDGYVMETWPAQIQAETITLKETQTDYFSLYKEALEGLYEMDSGLNRDAEYFGFDLAGINTLSTGEKALLAFDFSSEYDAVPLQGAIQELMEQGYIDEEKLIWEDGLHFTVREEKTDGNTVSCDVTKWKSGLGSVGYPVRAVWSDTAGWEFEDTGVMWIS